MSVPVNICMSKIKLTSVKVDQGFPQWGVTGVQKCGFLMLSESIKMELCMKRVNQSKGLYLLVQSQQQKHQNNVLSLFKVNNKTLERRHTLLFLLLAMKSKCRLGKFFNRYGYLVPSKKFRKVPRNEWALSHRQPVENGDRAGCYLFTDNNQNTRKVCEICSKAPQTSFWCLLLLTLSRFYTLFWFFHVESD